MRSSTEVILKAVTEDIIKARADQIKFTASYWLGLNHPEEESIKLANEALKRELLDERLNASEGEKKLLKERFDSSAIALLERLNSASLAPLQSPARVVKGQLTDGSEDEASPTRVATRW